MVRGFYDARSFRSGSIGGKSVFNCTCCGRSTRMTTQDDDSFCGECYELFGMQNTLWDFGVEDFKESGMLKHRDEQFKKLVSRKGDGEKVKKQMPDLFAVEA